MLANRQNLAQNLISVDEFKRRAAQASQAFNAEWTRGVTQIQKTLQQQGLGFTPRQLAAIQGQFKTGGQRASAAFAGALLLGKAANLQGGVAAEQMVRGLTQTLNQQKGRISRQVAEGTLDPAAGRRMWLNAQAEFNRALARGMSSLGPIGKTLEAALIKQFKPAGFKAGEAAAAEAARAFRESQRQLTGVAEGMERTGRALTLGLTVPTIALGTAIGRSAGQFEKGMNLVRANTGAGAAAFIELNERAREFGRESEFGATEITKGMAELALAGFQTNEIMAAMPSIMAMATAGQVDLARAADITTSVLRSQHLAVNESARVADVLVKAAITSQTDLNDLAVAFRYVGSIGESVGQTFEGMTAVLAAFSQAGYTASFAGTAFRGAMARLLDPTFRASKMLADLNVKLTDANDNLLPFSNIVEQFEKAGIKGAEAISIFAQRAGPGMASLISLGSERIRYFEAQLRGAGGTAETVQKIQLQGLMGELLRLRSAFQELAIAVGDSGFLGAITRTVLTLAGFIRRMAETNPALLNLVGSILIVGAALGPMALGIAKVTYAFIAMRAIVAATAGPAALGGLAAMLVPGGVILAGLALAAFLIYRFAERARKAHEELAKFRAEIAGLTLDQLRGLQTGIAQEIRQIEQQIASLPKTIESRAGKRLGIPIENPEVTKLNKSLEALRKRQTEVGKQIQETSGFANEQRRMFSDLTAIIAEANAAYANADFFKAPPGRGDKTAAEVFADNVQLALDRLEAMKSIGLAGTPEFVTAFDRVVKLSADAEKHIKAGGGALEASIEYLKAMEQIRERIKRLSETDFDEKARHLAELLRFRLEFAMGDHQQIIDQMETFSRQLVAMLGRADLDVDEKNRLRRAIQVIDDALMNYAREVRDRALQRAAWERRDTRPAAQQDAARSFTDRLISRFSDLEDRSYQLAKSWRSLQVMGIEVELAFRERVMAALESIPTPAELVVGAFDSLVAGAGRVAMGIGALPGTIIRALNPLAFFGSVLGEVASALQPTFEALAPVMEKFGAIMNNTLAPVFEALAPVIEKLFPVIQAIINLLTPIIVAIIPLFDALRIILQATFPVMKGLAIAVTYLAQIVFNVAGVFLDIIGFILKGVGEFIIAVGKLVNLLPGSPGDPLIKAGKNIRATGDAMKKTADALFEAAGNMSDARDEIKRTEIAGALTEVANAANKATENLLNVPDAYKVLLQLRRFEAQDPRAGAVQVIDIPQIVGRNAPTTSEVNFTFTGDIIVPPTASDPREQAASVLQQMQRQAQTKFGNKTRWPEIQEI